MKNRKRKKKIALFGCGRWGKNLINNLYRLKSLKYIYDINEKICKIFILKYKINFNNIYLILKNKNIKGIVISTPSKTHYKLAKLVLLFNKDVFIEKPFTKKIEHAYKLNYIANKIKKIIMVGHILQYHPIYIKLKKFIKKKYIGKLIEINVERLNNSYMKNEDVLWDYGPHDISIILDIMKQFPNKILAICNKSINKKKKDIKIQLYFKNKVKCNLHISQICKKKVQRLSIKGTKKKIIIDDTKIWDKKFYMKKNIKIKYKQPLINECEYFLACIKNRKIPLSSCNNSIKVIKILKLIELSIKNKEIIYQ